MTETTLYTRLSVYLMAGIIVAGFLLELLTLPRLTFTFPTTLVVFILITVILISIRLFLFKTFLFRWLSSIQNSLIAISSFILFTLIMALVPQSDNVQSFGLNSVLQSFPFIFVYIFLCITLGLVVLRRFYGFSKLRNVAFFLNHFGLWLLLMAGGIGSFDFMSLDMQVGYSSPVWYGYDKYNRQHELPFAIELKEFKLEKYLPKLQLVLLDSTVCPPKIKVIKEFELDTLNPIVYKDFMIHVKKFIPYTWWWGDSLRIMRSPGYVGSALVEVASKDVLVEGWISYASVMQKGKYLKVSSEHYLFLSEPIAKKYESVVQVYTSKGDNYISTVEVNKPLTVMGWKIYQKDYHKELGEYTDYSIFEINHDGWLPLVYAGIFMLLAGSVLLIVVKK